MTLDLAYVETYVLEAELERRRKAEKEEHAKHAQLQIAVTNALEAAALCMYHLPNDGQISPNQLKHAAELLHQLVYRTLPGGNEATGMEYAWNSLGLSEKDVSDVLKKGYENG